MDGNHDCIGCSTMKLRPVNNSVDCIPSEKSVAACCCRPRQFLDDVVMYQVLPSLLLSYCV